MVWVARDPILRYPFDLAAQLLNRFGGAVRRRGLRAGGRFPDRFRGWRRLPVLLSSDLLLLRLFAAGAVPAMMPVVMVVARLARVGSDSSEKCLGCHPSGVQVRVLKEADSLAMDFADASVVTG